MLLYVPEVRNANDIERSTTSKVLKDATVVAGTSGLDNIVSVVTALKFCMVVPLPNPTILPIIAIGAERGKAASYR